MVLKFMDKPPDNAAGVVSSDGRFEVQSLIGAITARKRTVDRAGERF